MLPSREILFAETRQPAVHSLDVKRKMRTEMRQRYEPVLGMLLDAVEVLYGGQLVTLAVFGSVGRCLAGPDANIDLLIVLEDYHRISANRSSSDVSR